MVENSSRSFRRCLVRHTDKIAIQSNGKDWSDIQKKLEAEPTKGATVLFQELQSIFPGRFANGQIRTLQRRVADWRQKGHNHSHFKDWTLVK